MKNAINIITSTFSNIKQITKWKIKITNEKKISLTYNNKKIFTTTPPQIGEIEEVVLFFEINNFIYSLKTDYISSDLLNETIEMYSQFPSHSDNILDNNLFFYIGTIKNDNYKLKFGMDNKTTQNLLIEIKKSIMYLYDSFHFELNEENKNLFISFNLSFFNEIIFNYLNNNLEQERVSLEILIKFFTISGIKTYIYNFSELPNKDQLDGIIIEINQDISFERSSKYYLFPERQYLFLLSPKAVNYIVKNIFLDMLNCNNILNDNSFLKIKNIGNRILNNIFIIDDPTFYKGVNSYYFDNEGVIAKKKYLFKDGIFIEPLLNYEDSATLKLKYGLEIFPKGNVDINNSLQFSNLFLLGSQKTIQELTNEESEIVFVNELSGFNLNHLNGDFILSCRHGYLYKDEKKQSLNNFNISGNILEILKDNKTKYSKEYLVENNFIPALSTNRIYIV